jgi:uncharacterized protein involved in exopolysaccharide biosynthesis
MTHPLAPGTDEFSLYSLGTTLLRNRWRIVRWSLALGVLAALTVINKPRLYRGSASFIPQGADQTRSNLASIAGQFGVSIPTTGQSLTPDFYVTLVKAPVLLRTIALDTFTVAEMNGRRVPFLELYGIDEGSQAARLEEAVESLKSAVNVGLSKTTNIIEVTVDTKWPSVSLAITEALVRGINEFNLHTRQGQAGAERKFVEGRMSVAGDELRQAENRVADFLKANRQYTYTPETGFRSPELTAQYDRLLRDVEMKQSVYTSLNQAYEEVRLREVRDTPVITVVEPPTVPTQALPRGRVKRVLIAMVAGAIIAGVLSFVSAITARRKREGDTEVDEFLGTLTELRARVPWIGARAPR